MARLTDHPDMTLDVYRGRKTTMQQQQNTPFFFFFVLFCFKVCHQPSFMRRLARASIIVHRAAHAYTISRQMACDAG